MPVFCDCPSSDNEDTKPTCAEHSDCEASSNGSLPSNLPTYWLKNSHFKIKTEECDDDLPESPPRMTIDGTCAPPRLSFSSFLNLAGSPATSPCPSPPTSHANVFFTRMSTGGRAPPKIPSPQRESLPSVNQDSMPTTSSSKVKTIEARRTSDRSSPEVSEQSNSTTTEIAVKRPRGRPKKSIQPQSSSHKTTLNQLVSKPHYVAIIRERLKKGSGSRPENPIEKSREMINENSASESEYLMKMPQGQPKKISSIRCENPIVKPGGMPVESSVSKSEYPMKRPRGRPKGSFKKRKVVQVKATAKSRELIKESSVSKSEYPMKRPRGRPKGSFKKRKVVQVKATAKSRELIKESSASDSEYPMKRPRGRPKGSFKKRKVVKVKATTKSRELIKESSASDSEYPMKRPRGRPKGSFKKRKVVKVKATAKSRELIKESSASESEYPMKRPRGRPKGSFKKRKVVQVKATAKSRELIKESSVSESEYPMKRPRGRPKGSFKKRKVVKALSAEIMRVPIVLLSKWTQKKEVSRSVRQAAEILANVKKRGRPKKRRNVGVGRPRKYVGDVASRNQDEMKSQSEIPDSASTTVVLQLPKHTVVRAITVRSINTKFFNANGSATMIMRGVKAQINETHARTANQLACSACLNHRKEWWEGISRLHSVTPTGVLPTSPSLDFTAVNQSHQ